MAEKRRLQQEMEKTLKRVEEGIEMFDDIFEKAQGAMSNQSQKEKLENELKREIKKLQRYRDQIKAWQTSSDIKDKAPLEEARRKIEKEMERFKVCEREFKMKAFSREGLAAKARVDPQEETRNRHREWLNTMMSKLSTGVDQYEAESEILARKKTPSKADSVREKTLENFVERHNWHIGKLEQILRRLENDTVDMSLLDDIRDYVEYYADQHEDPDFFDDQDMYNDLKLEQPEDLYIQEQKESDDLGSDGNDDDGASEVLSASPSNLSKGEKIVRRSDEMPESFSGPPDAGTNSSMSTNLLAAAPSETNAPSRDEAEGKGECVEPPIEDKASEEKSDQPLITPIIGASASLVECCNGKERNTTNLGDENLKPQNSDVESSDSFDDHEPDIELVQSLIAFSHANTPTPSDSSNTRIYTPKTACTNSHPSFPVAPLDTFDSPQFFELLDSDTLFFVFYYQPGSYQHYLAAKQLKRQAWRFHKKYFTWFQRHENPTTTTNQFEIGTYLYFDYENAWTSRVKQDFTFEYQWLEDELQV